MNLGFVKSFWSFLDCITTKHTFLNLYTICCIVLNVDVSLCISYCRILRPKAETSGQLSGQLSMLGEEVFGDQVEWTLRIRKTVGNIPLRSVFSGPLSQG